MHTQRHPSGYGTITSFDKGDSKDDIRIACATFVMDLQLTDLQLFGPADLYLYHVETETSEFVAARLTNVDELVDDILSTPKARITFISGPSPVGSCVVGASHYAMSDDIRAMADDD